MEKELNIAAILKDKPQGTKLYDWLHNIDVELDTISTTDTETVVWCTNETNNNTTCHRGYSEFGTERGYPDGLQILFPSEQMKDWSKFAWKKGDVLVSGDGGTEVIFDKWYDDAYTNFYGKHYLYSENENNIMYFEGFVCTTGRYFLESKDAAQTYINTIEERLGGKLNLETLEIEQHKPEFKDGDIVFYENPDDEDVCSSIFIFRGKQNDTPGFLYHAALNSDGFFNAKDGGFGIYEGKSRLATDSEKQQLFSALAKEGKRWNPDTKQIEDLPKKCEFKPMDWCLMKDSTKYWELCQFAYTRKVHGTTIYSAVGGLIYYKCIPYNDQTKHLLGTTDEWKGGEQ